MLMIQKAQSASYVIPLRCSMEVLLASSVFFIFDESAGYGREWNALNGKHLKNDMFIIMLKMMICISFPAAGSAIPQKPELQICPMRADLVRLWYGQSLVVALPVRADLVRLWYGQSLVVALPVRAD